MNNFLPKSSSCWQANIVHQTNLAVKTKKYASILWYLRCFACVSLCGVYVFFFWGGGWGWFCYTRSCGADSLIPRMQIILGEEVLVVKWTNVGPI